MSNKIFCSIIYNVLDSHGIVEKQCHYMKQILPENFEVILVDDGSNEPITLPFDHPRFKVVYTNDKRNWSMPSARNFGFNYAVGDFIYFSDIDHFISEDAINSIQKFKGDMLNFPRKFAILDNNNKVSRDFDTLVEYGLKKEDYDKISCHYNTFCIRREIFQTLKYDEKFSGKYGGDDVDFRNRYGDLYKKGYVGRTVTDKDSLIYVYPDPRRDVKEIFHSLRRKHKDALNIPGKQGLNSK